MISLPKAPLWSASEYICRLGGSDGQLLPAQRVKLSEAGTEQLACMSPPVHVRSPALNPQPLDVGSKLRLPASYLLHPAHPFEFRAF